MKKIKLILILLLTSLVVSAETYDDSIFYYGPQKKSFAVTFGALPIINFIGNMFNGTSNQEFEGFGSLSPTWYKGAALSAKYYVSDTFGVTAGIGLDCASTKYYNYDGNKDEENKVSTEGSHQFMFMVGIQYGFFPGKRLKPILGANLVYALSSEVEKIDNLAQDNANKNHATPVNTYGLIGNLGVEYFLNQSISISAVGDLGLCTTSQKKKVDDWDTTLNRVENTSFKAVTGKIGGNIAINFYF